MARDSKLRFECPPHAGPFCRIVSWQTSAPSGSLGCPMCPTRSCGKSHRAHRGEAASLKQLAGYVGLSQLGDRPQSNGSTPRLLPPTHTMHLRAGQHLRRRRRGGLVRYCMPAYHRKAAQAPAASGQPHPGGGGLLPDAGADGAPAAQGCATRHQPGESACTGGCCCGPCPIPAPTSTHASGRTGVVRGGTLV